MSTASEDAIRARGLTRKFGELVAVASLRSIRATACSAILTASALTLFASGSATERRDR